MQFHVWSNTITVLSSGRADMSDSGLVIKSIEIFKEKQQESDTSCSIINTIKSSKYCAHFVFPRLCKCLTHQRRR